MKQTKNHLLTLVICLMFIGHSIAGTPADSLKKIGSTQKDSALIDTYHNLARYYFQADRNPDSMIKYAKLATDLAVKLKYKGRILKTKKALGLAYTEARKVDLAKQAYDDAMSIAQQTKNVEEIIAINNKLGYLYGTANDLGKSAFYYLNSAKEFEKLKDYANLAFTYKNVVVIFTMQEQYDKILEYTDKALALLPKLNEKEHADVYVGIYSSAAQHYFLVGERKVDTTYIKKALAYADTCLDVSIRNNMMEGAADAYYIISYGYRIKKDYPNTILYAKKALSLHSNLNARDIFNVYSSLCGSYSEMGDYKSAERYLDTIKQFQVGKEVDAPVLISELEYNLYKKMGKYKEAIAALENIMKWKNEALTDERIKTINDLEVKYQTELKEAKISELNQQREIDDLRLKSLIGIVVAITFVLLAVVFFYRQSVIKNKLKRIETEQRLNRARMNPHFFFNVLASIQTMILEEQEPAKSALMISKFSKIMRQSLESTYTELVTVEEEQEFISNYLDIQKMRYDNRFTYNIELGNDVDESEMSVPSMLIQPFVENAIEHGFRDLERAGKLTIKFEKEHGLLKVSCEDNGHGFKTVEKHKSYPSRATQIVKERLELLNKQFKSNARFDLQSETGVGTKVSIYLPLLSK